MSIVKYSAEKARSLAKVNREKLKASGGKHIAKHAAEDDSSTDQMDFAAALKDGRLRAIPKLDVPAIRSKTGLSQDRFARVFQISPHTLRNWEQGRRVPDGPARALLMAIDRDPKALMRALGA
ncbi:MAG: helix-turn-helix domain-containing protein [Pseudomonadota bacterium]